MNICEEKSMKIEQIEQLWSDDSTINTTDLTKETIKIPQLHAKYYAIYVKQRLLLVKLKAAYKQLKLEKYEFLINPTEEKVKAGWKIPAQGKLLKNEVAQYLEGDQQLIEMELKIGIQEEKVGYLKSIIDSINTRNFLIKNILDDRKFMNGG